MSAPFGGNVLWMVQSGDGGGNGGDGGDRSDGWWLSGPTCLYFYCIHTYIYAMQKYFIKL